MTAGERRALEGYVDPRLGAAVALVEEAARSDPDFSIQVAALHRGVPVLDAWIGPHLGPDSLIVPFSVTKNAIGLTVGLLLQRGLLDLDARVSDYWPEFAQAGKAGVTVRMLLSHQAGIPEARPVLRAEEVFDGRAAAARLAATPPVWQPGSAFGYHGLTIGTLASELVHRITGRSTTRRRSAVCSTSTSGSGLLRSTGIVSSACFR
ncbi:serine hydrolase domain-containing protein [Microbacterium tumbae]